MANMNALEELQTLISPEMVKVEELITSRMKSSSAPRIPEVTAHIIAAGGKKLRPMLSLATAKLFDYQGENHIKLAATIEFIHTATLLHDDVVDESIRRRGKKTANVLWDNKSSVLVGDYLFSRSFELMVETGSLEVLKILASAAAEIAEGEVLQLTETNNLKLTTDNYMRIIHGKTAALFIAACETGAIIANASENQLNAMKNYGNCLGVSFQLVDDYLDYNGSSETMGKDLGDDFQNGKITFPLLKTLQLCSKEELLFFKRTIAEHKQEQKDLEKALHIMRKYGTLKLTKDTAILWVEKAKNSLSLIPDNDLKQALLNLADYTVTRII